MSHPVTRAKNSSQHPGQIVLEGKQKRCTSEQKQADDAQAEHILNRTEQEEENLLTNPPRPRPRIVVKSPVDPSTRLENSEHSSGAETDLDRPPRDGLEDSQLKPEDSLSQQEESDNEAPQATQALSKRQQTQKMFTRDAVQAAQGEVGTMDSQPEKQKQQAPRSGSRFKDPCATPLSTSTHLSTPTSDNFALESQECGPHIQGSDQGERKAMHRDNSSSKAVTRRINIMDIAEVVSDSELGEWVSPPPVVIQSRTKKGSTKGSNTKDSKKWIQQSDQGNEEDSQTAAPPSKRTKAAPRSTSGTSHRSGSGVNNKYVKDDLPPGSTVDNIWDAVYGGEIEHTVTIGGPVYHIAKQSLNNWRSGFAAATVAVITTFFANDTDLENPDQRVEFAKSMLKKSRFLFNQNRGMDNKAWSGLWRAPFVLQTFAHQFNFIQGRVGVAILDKELAGPHARLALACTAVCRMLTLVSNKHITFKSGNPGNVWTTVIPKGTQYEFNETIWGISTRCYLDPIKELTDENFALIVEDSQKYVKKASLTLNSVDLGEEDSKFEDLFAFH
ncbi:hypothetical protein BDN67DRAFT_1014127 [Paxillus ammoniavirescens]|nr:hypothetical protein BDN67DRAFT_1014127 [Paxillus ammoniavirescens]